MEETKQTTQSSETVPNQTPPAGQSPPSGQSPLGRRLGGASPTPPQANPFFKLTKPVLIGLGAIILLVSAFASYFVISLNQKAATPQQTVPSSTPDPGISNWKIYRNQGLAYSISYPLGWSVYDPEDPSLPIHIISPNKVAYEDSVNVIIEVEKSNLSLREWLKGKTIGGKCCPENFNLDEVETNSLKFYKVSMDDSPYIGIAKSHNGNIYYIYSMFGAGLEGAYYDDKNDKILNDDLKLVDQILSTFKFTDSSEENQTVCTQEVKICPDGSYVGRQGPKCEFAPCP